MFRRVNLKIICFRINPENKQKGLRVESKQKKVALAYNMFDSECYKMQGDL
jgi:hypothetical protein